MVIIISISHDHNGQFEFIVISTLKCNKQYTLKDEYGPEEIRHHTTETIREIYIKNIEDTLKVTSQHN